MEQRGETGKTLEQVEDEISKRDANDMGRAYMPLRIAEDAVVVDTTDMTADEVVEYLVRKIEEL